MSKTITLPKTLEIGSGGINKLPEIIASLNNIKPCIVTDPMMVELGYAKKIQKILSQNNISHTIFSETIPEPTDASIEPGIEHIIKEQCDCIIALGGGSAIDSAKAMSVVAKHGGCISDYKTPADVTTPGLNIIAIPTTAGTGSEVTRFTVITNTNTDEKMLCSGAGFLPTAAIIDYEFTLSLPARVTADTGIDALTHAIEAFVSRKANPFSDQQALSAIKLIAPNIRTVYQEPNNRKAREAMMLGATLAGMAFSNASVGLVHGMSRPIGAHFHVPHGLSNAMILPTVTEFSLAGAPEKYAECSVAMGLCQSDDSIDIKNEKLIRELKALNKDLAVPSLSEFKVSKDKYEKLISIMAEQAMDSGSPSNNPRIPTHDEMVNLYLQAWC